MALTPDQVGRHNSKQNDIKQFIQVLTPLCGIPVNGVAADHEVQKLAVEKLKELIPMIKCGFPEEAAEPTDTTLKKLS